MGFKIQKQDALEREIVLDADFTAEDALNLWQMVREIWQHTPKSAFTINGTELKKCAKTALLLLNSLKQEGQARFKLEGFATEFVFGLRELASKLPKEQQFNKEEVDFSLPELVGARTISFGERIYGRLAEIGEFGVEFWRWLKRPQNWRITELIQLIDQVGREAVPIVMLIGFLFGLIFTFQASPTFTNFGAQIYLVNLVALGLAREMGPLITAILLAGRTASAFAAEIGSMKLNYELDALTTLGINPLRFLVVPRVVVTMVITPLLEGLFILCGITGTFVVMLALGFTGEAFFSRLSGAVKVVDYLGGVFKATILGMVIALTGCLEGLRVKLNATAVGRATTQAVVNSLVMLVIVDGIFALLYYLLKI